MQKNVIEYLEKNMSDMFLKQVAVIDKEKEHTFYELLSDSKMLASRIIDCNDQILQPISVFLPKSYDVIIADLAIVYSGNIYNNLDIKSPPLRNKSIIDNIGSAAIITKHEYTDYLLSIGVTENKIIYLDSNNWNEVGNRNDDVINARLVKIIDTDPVCIINTSGSTGIPKSVVMNHRSIIDFIDNASRELAIDGTERIGSLSPFYFDIFTFELYMCLAHGSVICIIPDGYASFPAKLAEYLQDNQISLIFWVPTIMVNMANLDILSSYELKHLKKILFAGEVFPIKHFNYWCNRLPQAVFVNMYGPIEITVDCLYYIVDKKFSDQEVLPIGKAFNNTDILILNENDQECNAGEIGELCVRGSSLAMGYWNDFERTKKVFVQNPLNKKYPELIYRTGDSVYCNDNGEVIFIGRKDFQIKHSGYRIELSEIENAILGVENINNACVLYNKLKKEIVLVYESDDTISLREFRTVLAKKIPKYMIPSSYIKVEQMPRNANGKIDRNHLMREVDGRD